MAGEHDPAVEAEPLGDGHKPDNNSRLDATTTGPARGLLDISIELSRPDLTAGHDFTLYLLITNPYDMPVTIENVSVVVPSDLTGASRGHKAERPESQKTNGAISTLAQMMRVGATTNQRGDEQLQPGDKVTYARTFRTSEVLWFQPSEYKLYFNVAYGVDSSVLRHNSIPITLSIRATTWPIVVGAVVGSLFGSAAHILQGMKSTDNLLTIQTFVVFALATILSIASVVLIARKSGTQSPVTVEDIWGGAVTGFLIGYLGISAFQGIVGIPASPAP